MSLSKRMALKTRKLVSLWAKTIVWEGLARQEMSDNDLLEKLVGHWDNLPLFLDHLTARPSDTWLLPHASRDRVKGFITLQYPDYGHNIILAAQAACQGKFNLLGHPVSYPEGMDWQRDPLSGWRWPVIYRERLDRLVWSPNPPADLTLIWELNRHQHLPLLGIAYWITQDDRYPGAFARQVTSWIEQNPLQNGIHWHSSLEVALRVIAWTVAFQIFRPSPQVQGIFGALFLKSLFQQVDFIKGHLQTNQTAVPNNHLVAELAALAIAGAVFPEFKAAGAWRETGMNLIAEHILRQTNADGVNKEQATGYHRFVAELLCLLVALGRRRLLTPAPLLEDALAKMLDYLMYSTSPEGSLPHWGDCGYARALGLEPEENYFDSRWLLAVGAVLFERPDWKSIAGEFSVQAFWLLGEDGWRAWERLPDQTPPRASRAFPRGGIYILRSDWSSAGDLCLFRCGPFGLGEAGPCAHAHCDLLSPLLWIQGREFLVDPGTFFYSGRWRNPFRLTGVHNTLKVDDCEQADPLSPFGWKHIRQAECLEWDGGQRVVGSLMAAPEVRHIREVFYLTSGTWRINDYLRGEGLHRLSWNFQLAPGLSVRGTEKTRELAVSQNGIPFVMILPPEGVMVEIKSGWVSRFYGLKEPAPRLAGNWRGGLNGSDLLFSWEFISCGEMVQGENR